jgi:hypothetical protein
MDEGNSRIQVIQIDTNASPICLINVYMPSDNKEMDCEYRYDITTDRSNREINSG